MEELLHRTATVIARQLVDVVSVCLRPEERQDALLEFYRTVREGLETFAAEARLRDDTPSRN